MTVKLAHTVYWKRKTVIYRNEMKVQIVLLTEQSLQAKHWALKHQFQKWRICFVLFGFCCFQMFG